MKCDRIGVFFVAINLIVSGLIIHFKITFIIYIPNVKKSLISRTTPKACLEVAFSFTVHGEKTLSMNKSSFTFPIVFINFR